MGVSVRALKYRAVLETILIFFLAPIPPGGPEGGSGLSSSSGVPWFWADSGPDQGSNVFVILVLVLSAARSIPVRLMSK